MNNNSITANTTSTLASTNEPTTPITVTDKRERGNKWNSDEDCQLVKAYLEIATDEVKGKNQDGAKFWDRIFDEFQKYGNPNERTAHKIEGRFLTINRCISKFCGCMMEVERHPRSGEVEEDKWRRAIQEYKRTSLSRDKNFNVKPCFELLKTQKKWYGHPEHKKDAPSVDGPETERPIGVKKAKSNKKRSNEDVEKVEQLEMELARKRVAMDEIRTKKIDELVFCAKLMAEHAFMSVDMSNMTADQRCYYQQRQQEILKRMREEKRAEEEEKVVEGEDDDEEEDEDEVATSS
ncbi:hypothetical protein INT45_008020 [Circinella minor]|uniref:No apical meristem-associated C-terminal domain-containing protein n=1 Tax=Circinella minor TaxID=1195481 RepID=A0A8H7SA84_9FUNG|nr:hypothetical protein INT45_000634 [Circinella minor]KAG2224838.1 hypothetical protein INT45_008020 [Circinella minor]